MRDAAIVALISFLIAILWRYGLGRQGCNGAIPAGQAYIARALSVLGDNGAACPDPRTAIAALQRAAATAARCRQVPGRQMSLHPYLSTSIAAAAERVETICRHGIHQCRVGYSTDIVRQQPSG